MSKVGRNVPCTCGSGRKAKRCCGVERGPSAESLARAFLSHAAQEAADELHGASGAELVRLYAEMRRLPALDLSLQVELPKLLSPALDRLCHAVAADDPRAGRQPFGEVLGLIDTPLERARLARAVIALRSRGKLDERLAAGAVIDLASRSRALIGASLVEAVAVRVGAARTPAGLLLAA